MPDTQNPNAPTDRPLGESFDLVDLWILFRSRALVFWAVFVLVLAAGIGFGFSRVPQFRYTAVMHLGSQRIGERFVPAMPGALVQRWIEDSLAPLLAGKLKKEFPEAQAIASRIKVSLIPQGSGLLLQVDASRGQAKTVRALLAAIGQKVQKISNTRLLAQEEKREQLLKNEIRSLEKEIHTLQAQQERIGHGTSVLRRRASFHVIELLAVETAHLMGQKNHVERLLNRKTIQLTRPLGPISRSAEPVGRSVIGWIGIFLLLGLILGAALVILLHLRDQAKKRLDRQAGT